MAAGAEIINDITALTGDPAMIAVALETRRRRVRHAHAGTPQTMQDDPRYDDVVAEVLAYLRARRDALLAAGIDPRADRPRSRHRLRQDAPAQPDAVGRLPPAARAGQPAAGRAFAQGFHRQGASATKQADRTAGTIGVALALAAQGVQILRVHDVAAVRQALLLFEATGGIDGTPANVEGKAEPT